MEYNDTRTHAEYVRKVKADRIQERRSSWWTGLTLSNIWKS